MPNSPTVPLPDPSRRLRKTLIISVVVHALVIFGISFTTSDPASIVPTLDVIFSQTQTPLTPKQADFLAQANQQGGGDHETAQRPSDSQSGIVPQQQEGMTQVEQRATHVRETPDETRPRTLTSAGGDDFPTPIENPRPRVTDPSPADAQRQQRDAEMARLAAEIHLRSEQYAKRPNRKFVSASTREYEYANYLRAWVDRAERIGNLNYPDEARQHRLGGKVVVTAGIRRNGSVESSRVLVSSGSPTLDNAALRMISLAQPFPPLPQTKDGVDILQITRTWIFVPAGQVHDDHR